MNEIIIKETLTDEQKDALVKALEDIAVNSQDYRQRLEAAKIILRLAYGKGAVE